MAAGLREHNRSQLFAICNKQSLLHADNYCLTIGSYKKFIGGGGGVPVV